MSGKGSSSQSGGGLNGSGSLSHVYTQYPPLRCSVPGSRGLYYDDGTKLLLSPSSDQVFSWKTAPFDPLVAPSSDPISEGPIVSIRYSLDLKFIAIQRSNQIIQFWNRETGETFTQRCRSESDCVLGFFWTDCSTCDIVFVKTSGLDFFSYNSESRSLHLVETKKLNVSWYVYTHESRLILLASGMQCKSFTGYQLSSAGITKLPKFEMTMAKSEGNSKPVLAAEDIHIVTIYGRIYCLQVDRVVMLLHIHRFYRDAVVQQGSLPIFSSKITVSVVDNVLLVHQVDAKVVILYDIFADSRAPISAPLPLLMRGFPRVNSSRSRLNSNDPESSGLDDKSGHKTNVYGDDWNFLVPDLICDVTNGFLWKTHLDLEAISTSSSEVPPMLEFLQRRKLNACKAKQLCLALTRTLILERRPVSTVAKALDVLVTSYSHSIKSGINSRGTTKEKSSPSSSIAHAGASRILADESSVTNSERNESYDQSHFHSFGGKSGKSTAEAQPSSFQSQIQGPSQISLNANVCEQQESELTSAAISPDEIYSYVLAPVEEELAGDPSYTIAIIIDFLRSANSEKIKVQPNVHVLTVQVLARNEQYAELGQFIFNKIIEPSKDVAMQLIESGRQHFQTRKLGLDMLRQLGLHHDYVLYLAQDGYYLEALRYARKNKVNTIRPSLFLEAAFASNDSQHVAAVLRFFLDFIPGFKNTSDHNRYCEILNEMNSAVAA